MFLNPPKCAPSIIAGDHNGHGAAAATVYIVDDDAAVRDALSLLVLSCGWRPYACASAEEFLESYSRERNACLLLDLQMPGMSGADLQESLAEMGLTLPTIIITAHPEQALALRARAAGALAVVSKPFRQGELLLHIEQALGREQC